MSLVIRTERLSFSNGYSWNIYSAEISISSNKPYRSRKLAKEAAKRFIEDCLVDYEDWNEEYR